MTNLTTDDRWPEPRWSVDVADRIMFGPVNDGEWIDLWEMAPNMNEAAFYALVRELREARVLRDTNDAATDDDDDDLPKQLRDLHHFRYPGDETPTVYSEAADEIDRLRRWKREATEVIERWDKVFDALGRPGRLGELKSVAAKSEVERLRAEVHALRDQRGTACLVDDMAAVPALVRAKRERRGLSYRDLAALTGVSTSLLHRYEHGQSEPTLSNLVKLVRWLRSDDCVKSDDDRLPTETPDIDDLTDHASWCNKNRGPNAWAFERYCDCRPR